ncbi:FH1/FH2 domain-containing protein 3 [Plecturocebus cupreus]
MERQGLTLLPRLEYSGPITAYYSLKLLGSKDPPTSASQKAPLHSSKRQLHRGLSAQHRQRCSGIRGMECLNACKPALSEHTPYKTAADGKRQEIIVLDSKRSNAINIGLTVLPPPRTIKIAILNFDEYALNKEGIEDISHWIWGPLKSRNPANQESEGIQQTRARGMKE